MQPPEGFRIAAGKARGADASMPTPPSDRCAGSRARSPRRAVQPVLPAEALDLFIAARPGAAAFPLLEQLAASRSIRPITSLSPRCLAGRGLPGLRSGETDQDQLSGCGWKSG